MKELKIILWRLLQAKHELYSFSFKFATCHGRSYLILGFQTYSIFNCCGRSKFPMFAPSHDSISRASFTSSCHVRLPVSPDSPLPLLPFRFHRRENYASIVNTSWSIVRVALLFRIEIEKRGETEIRTADLIHDLEKNWRSRPLGHHRPTLHNLLCFILSPFLFSFFSTPFTLFHLFFLSILQSSESDYMWQKHEETNSTMFVVLFYHVSGIILPC